MFVHIYISTFVHRQTCMNMYICSITEFSYHNEIPLFSEFHISKNSENSTDMVDKSKYFYHLTVHKDKLHGYVDLEILDSGLLEFTKICKWENLDFHIATISWNSVFLEICKSRISRNLMLSDWSIHYPNTHEVLSESQKYFTFRSYICCFRPMISQILLVWNTYFFFITFVNNFWNCTHMCIYIQR